MPYQDVKVLNIKNMEIKGQDGIVQVYTVQDPFPFQDRSWGESQGFVGRGKGFIA